MNLRAIAGRLVLTYLGFAILAELVLGFIRLDRAHEQDIADSDRKILLESSYVALAFEDLQGGTPTASLQRRLEEHRWDNDSTLFVHVCTSVGPQYDSRHIGESFVLCQLSHLPLPFLVSIDRPDISLRLAARQAGAYRIFVARPVPSLLQRAVREPADLLQDVPEIMIFLLIGGLMMAVAFNRLSKAYSRSIMDSAEHPTAASPLERLKPPTGFWKYVFGPVYDVIQRFYRSRNQALSFASYASHELRSPLAIIRNQLEESMSEGRSGARLRRTISSTYDEVLRLSRSIDDLLSLATMQAGTFQLNKVQVPLNKFLKEFYDEALLLARPKNVSVVLKHGPSIAVAIDLQRFRQLLFNLLDNALKYTDSGGRIRISFTVEQGFALLSFSDTGRGISPEALPHIFQPFYRDPQSIHVSGSGLGLALVRWIAELHGGSVAIASDLGHGTTFTLRIPVISPEGSM